MQVIELDFEQLPDGDEVLSILEQENAVLHIWVTVGVSQLKYLAPFTIIINDEHLMKTNVFPKSVKSLKNYVCASFFSYCFCVHIFAVFNLT